jgi:hypothetical protein
MGITEFSLIYDSVEVDSLKYLKRVEEVLRSQQD